MKIGIILGSIREGRNGEAVAKWTLDFAQKRQDGVEYELVDLKDYDLPLLGLAPTDAQAASIKAWSEKMASFDGYIIVTAEYNRAVPGALKNALDYLQPELHNKSVGFVAYGGLGGLAAIQSLRLTLAEQELADVRTMVTFSLMTDFENMSVFKPHAYHEGNATKMMDQVTSWAKALKTIR
ncbi:NAD(P)H-dependent oxidoreductase [Erysipelothrix inopinata]|uniref:NAD(P)H-dependent oxidoreductase n=1 Tax=Erysipelothrix inopinata TaxID=225084 RepID=A0A7G9S127_9FIRM|nr:NAD(P)H-dependent oxidoreductase [Erysipelothrix inopinata]QNN61552.1 NAD(P)H-dependent oxidoreductase [Erysipelothrix inopinata]